MFSGIVASSQINIFAKECPIIRDDRSTTYLWPLKIPHMNSSFVTRIAAELEELRTAGLFKTERIIASAQGAEIMVNGKKVLNFCANNYLGLSSHPRVVEAAQKAVDHRGYGMSSVRFICGTQDIHKELEQKLSAFLGTEDTILYAAAFDANGAFLSLCWESRTPSFPMN